MKFLCFPGANCNAKTFRAQLGLFCDNLEADGTANFLFTQGTIPVSIQPEFEGFFGPPPNYIYIQANVPLEVIRWVPRCETPEDTMREIMTRINLPSGAEMQSVVEYFMGILEAEADITGLIGFSQGAQWASSIILQEQKRYRECGRIPRIQYAVFCHGAPPFDVAEGRLVLADEVAEVISIPTCHVVSTQDPLFDLSMALYNVCEASKAELFDHGGFHAIPREPQLVAEMAEIVRNGIKEVESSQADARSQE